jgi:hypothetical protein
MATKAQLDRLAARVEALAIALDPNPAVEVTVFRGETAEHAMRRHRELRPEHAGRRVSLIYDNNERTEGLEVYAVLQNTEEDREMYFTRIEAIERNDILCFRTIEHERQQQHTEAPPTPPAAEDSQEAAA